MLQAPCLVPHQRNGAVGPNGSPRAFCKQKPREKRIGAPCAPLVLRHTRSEARWTERESNPYPVHAKDEYCHYTIGPIKNGVMSTQKLECKRIKKKEKGGFKRITPLWTLDIIQSIVRTSLGLHLSRRGFLLGA